MKAILNLTNIGQLVGPQKLEFNSGVVTLITGRTAAGKSRIIKSYALALSYPILSENLRNDGINFGILKSEDAEYLPLVNSSKESATIELSYNDVIKKVELLRGGKITTNDQGNQKFLYSSMLVKNSRIHNNITQGNAEFKWIVDEMSLAKDYEKTLSAINLQLNNLDAKKVEVKENRDIIAENEEEIKKQVEEKKQKTKELTTKQLEIDNYEFDDEATEKRDEIQKEIKGYKNDLKELKKEKLDADKELEYLKKKINAENQIPKIREELKEKNEKLDDLKTINVQSLQEEIIEKQNLRSKEAQGKVRFETTLELWKKVNIEEGNKCPLCQSVGKISKEERENKIEECNTNIKIFKDRIKDFSSSINQKQSRINEKKDFRETEDKVEELLTKVENIEREAAGAKDKLKPAEKRQETMDTQIKKNNTLIVNLEANLNKLKEEMTQEAEYQQRVNEKSEIQRKIGMIDEKSLKLKDNINKAQIVEILETGINLDVVDKIIEEFIEILSKVKNHLDLRIREQREGAAKKFNASIKNLIKELKFDTFKEIYLDMKNYRLTIIERNDDSQELSSVSGGEKAIISSLLQISAKETYLSDIPFLIGDEIILDLDPERSEIFLNYLKKIAKEKDWFIILTKMTSDDLKIVEI